MNNSYHIIRIQKYLNGQLSKDEMYELEREALNDPMLNDALEGYRLQENVDHGRLSLLQQRLATRIEGKKQERDRFYFGSHRLSIAATAAVMFILVVVLYYMRSQITSEMPAERIVEIELPSDATLAGVTGVEIQVLEDNNAVPNGGWEAFNAFMQQEAKYGEASGVVDLTYKVGSAGQPTAIEIIGTPDPLLAQEATRLLQSRDFEWSGDRGQIRIVFGKE